MSIPNHLREGQAILISPESVEYRLVSSRADKLWLTPVVLPGPDLVVAQNDLRSGWTFGDSRAEVTHQCHLLYDSNSQQFELYHGLVNVGQSIHLYEIVETRVYLKGYLE